MYTVYMCIYVCTLVCTYTNKKKINNMPLFVVILKFLYVRFIITKFIYQHKQLFATFPKDRKGEKQNHNYPLSSTTNGLSLAMKIIKDLCSNMFRFQSYFVTLCKIHRRAF